MKKPFAFLTFLLMLAISFQSCSIQKRTYNKGYSLQIYKPHFFAEKPIASQLSSKNKNLTVDKIPIIQLEKKILEEKATSENIYRDSLQPCDIIFLVDGQLINAYVIEINDDEIKYVKCDNPYGPFYFTAKKNIHKIVYPNGSSDNFNSLNANVRIIPSPTPNPSPSSVPANPSSNLTQDSITETNNSENTNSPIFSVLSFLLSIILWFTPIDLSIVLMLLSILFAAIGISSKYLRGFAILGFIITLMAMLILLSA